MARVLTILALMVVTGVAQAASKVVVLAPADGPADTREAVTRTEAELAAEGFEVEVLVLAPNADPRRLLERTAAASDAAAVIAIFPTADGTTADVWVTDRITLKTSVRQVRVGQLPPDERPRALSIRAVELLRASLVEAIAPETEEQPRERVPATVVTWLKPPKAPFDGLGAAVGVGLLTGFDGIGPAGAPVARLSYGEKHGIVGRLSWLGPAFGGRADGDLGGASIRQELLTLDLAYAPHVRWAGFTPMVWLGAGALHLDAAGDLRPPLVARRVEIWSFALTGGAGLGYRLTSHVTAMLDAAALFAVPRPVITIEGTPIATTGRPALTSSVGVAIRFE